MCSCDVSNDQVRLNGCTVFTFFVSKALQLIGEFEEDEVLVSFDVIAFSDCPGQTSNLFS